MFSQYKSAAHMLSFSTLLIVISIIVISSLPQPVRSHPLAPTEPKDVPHRHYCSSSLFEAIQAICNGRYNSLSNVFPDSFGSYNRASLLKRLMPDEESYHSSNSGPAHVCCTRPCGYSELHSYCAD